jgi:hypothetical protein
MCSVPWTPHPRFGRCFPRVGLPAVAEVSGRELWIVCETLTQLTQTASLKGMVLSIVSGYFMRGWVDEVDRRRRTAGGLWLSVCRRLAQVATFNQFGDEFGASLGSRPGFTLHRPEKLAGRGGFEVTPFDRVQQAAGMPDGGAFGGISSHGASVVDQERCPRTGGLHRRRFGVFQNMESEGNACDLAMQFARESRQWRKVGLWPASGLDVAAQLQEARGGGAMV